MTIPRKRHGLQEYDEFEVRPLVFAEFAGPGTQQKESEGFKLAGNEGCLGESKERAFVVWYFSHLLFRRYFNVC